MDLLWTPWRYSYITKTRPAGRPGVPEQLESWPGEDAGCVFCNLIHSVDWAIQGGTAAEDADRYGLIVARGEHGYICLNRFPYASGHVLIVPYRHTDSFADLGADEAGEMMRQAQAAETVLRQMYRPDGINFGMNLGEAAGAGVASHLHQHVLPRWFGDTNFMTVTGETRIIPELLEDSWSRLREAFLRNHK